MQAVRARAREGSSDELAVIAQRAQASTNASGTAIALSEGNAAEMICRARAGPSAPDMGTALRVEGTFTGLCVQSGKELLCDDAETDTRVDKAAIRALGIRSMVAIPIKEEGRVVGVLAAFAPTAHAFTTAHVAVLKTMAGQIAAYPERKQRDEAYSAEPLTAPPVKAGAVSAAMSQSPPPAAVTKPAAPTAASMPRQRPVVPKVEPVRAATSAEEIDPAPSSKKPAPFTKKPATISKKTDSSSRDERKESKTDYRPAFSTLDAAAEPESKLRANVLIIGAAAVLVIAVAVGLSLKLRKPAAAPQVALETSSSPGTPAPLSANVQPPAKESPATPLAKRNEAQPEHEEDRPEREVTVVLPSGPSRIPAARDNSAPASDAPAISLGNVSTSGTLLNLAGPTSQASRPRLLKQSEFEPVRVIKKVPPLYPLVARQRGLTGSVVVQGTISKNGKISDLQLISGSPLFREAAFEALKQWVFQPARLNGQALEQSTQIRLDFGVR
jgi:TonB family protein